MKKFLSRKLLLTVGAILLVVTANLVGAPMDEAALGAVVKLVLGLVGAQGLVDFGEAWRAGNAITEAVDSE